MPAPANGYVGIMLLQRMAEAESHRRGIGAGRSQTGGRELCRQPFEGVTGIAWAGAIQEAATAI